MSIDSRGSLIVIILLSSVLLSITVTGVFLVLKYKKYRSRPYLLASLIFLIQSFGILGILKDSLFSDQINAFFDAVLRPSALLLGLMPLFSILAYISEIKFPGKLSLRKFLLVILPIIAVSVILFIEHPISLHSPGEIIDNIGRPDVWLRLILVLFYIIYPIVVAILPYGWRKCLVSRKMIFRLHVLSFFLSPMFIIGLVCGFFPAILMNFILIIIFDTLVAYIELRIRIPAEGSDRELKTPSVREQTCESILDSPEIWMNPDMTVAKLAKIMGTNRTYLLDRIKGLGYQNYSDLINRKRVGYICERLESETDVNIIDLMFDAGYRSRSTASREFKRIVGCTPSEYQDSKTN